MAMTRRRRGMANTPRGDMTSYDGSYDNYYGGYNYGGYCNNGGYDDSAERTEAFNTTFNNAYDHQLTNHNTDGQG